MASWEPNPNSLTTLSVCLKDSLSGFNKAQQKQAESMLSQARESPDFNNYLAYLFSSPAPPPGVSLTEKEYTAVRAAAAIMLKNNIKLHYKEIPEHSLALVKLAIPMGIQDKEAFVRNHAGNIATELIRRGGLYSWPEFLPQLLKLLSNESGHVSNEAQEGAMTAMAKICEDNTKILEREHGGQRPLNFMLPKFVEAAKSPLPVVRIQALTAINVFTSRKSQAMLNTIDALLQQLFLLAEDPVPDVRRQVCRAFVNLVETRPDKLLPHIGGLVDYIIAQQKNHDVEDLACEAAEFWLSVGEHEHLWRALEPYITSIIPVLLECMVYSPEDMALLGGASDDEDEDDKDEDIKPQFAKKKLARAGHGGVHTAGEKVSDMGGQDDLEDGEIDGGGSDDNDNEDDDDDDGDENPDERWTLRKCSAAALDVFARDFGSLVFNTILPYLQTSLKHQDWPHREAAVLALGAVAEGCMDVVVPHLPELVPYLISLLEDTEPVVRQITCWTLGRYSQWAAELSDPVQRGQYFEPLLEGMLRKMLDRNKKVQEAGASAMAHLEEKARKRLEPYCGPIVQQYIVCFQKYKDRNMWILYDCVQTLAESVGPVLAEPSIMNRLMPVLIDRWQKVGDQSRELFPLLECLSYVAMALGDSFSPYAEPIFRRCVNIIHQNLEQSLQARSNAQLEAPDKDFLVTSLDLLSSVIQALRPDQAAQLVESSQPAFFELLSFCMEDPTDDVQQSAYALLGDCAKFVFVQLRPSLPCILPILLKRLDLDNILDEEVDGSFSVVNNAFWSAGEIAMQYKKDIAPFVSELFERCAEIITNPVVPRGVIENAAICLGRLGLDNHELLAQHLPHFADNFLNSMDEIEPTDEKATALKGFSMIVSQNPQAMEQDLVHFFQAIARYRDMHLVNARKAELHDTFQNIINIYKQIIPQFDQFLQQLSAQDLGDLKTNYVV